MRITTTHIGFKARKQRGAALEMFNIDHCVNDHAGICYIMEGRPRNLMRQYDLAVFLRALAVMQQFSPESGVKHLEHNHIMSCTLTYEESLADSNYIYHVGSRLYARLLKSRSFKHG